MRNGRAAAVPLREHRVHVRDQQHLAFARAGKARDDVVANRGHRREVSMVAPSLLQLLDGDGADRIDAVRVAGAGIDVDQPLPQLDRIGLVALGAVEDWLVRLGRCADRACPATAPRRQWPASRSLIGSPPARSGNACCQSLARGCQHAALGDQPGDQPRRRHVEAVVRDRRAVRHDAHASRSGRPAVRPVMVDCSSAPRCSIGISATPSDTVKSMVGDGSAT